jgi:hypothetical protein
MIIDAAEPGQTLSSIRGLIVIDCWERPELDSFYQCLQDHVDITQFDSIMVANYELALDSKALCQHNTLEVYSWETYTPGMLLPMLKESGSRKTSAWLQSMFSSNSFLILDEYSLVHHCTTAVPHIKDWLVIGGSWQVCIHGRPLGFYKLKTLPYNFYVIPAGLYNTKKLNWLGNVDDLHNDQLTWIDQGNHLYKLQNQP